MSSDSNLPYRLRPNKSVDRELFLSLLTRLAATLEMESYQYIGLGGAFLEDFRLVHARLGISDMVCIESKKAVHKRQLFNRPIDCIECVHDTMENYLDSTELEKPAVIWFDYTNPGTLTTQIERFSRTIAEVPLKSILRITTNASPSSLGKPKEDEVAVEIGNMDSHNGNKKTIQEWRLDRFRERLGNLFPSSLTADGMNYKNYGKSVLTAISLSVEKEVLSLQDRKIIWSLATHYADGQAMVTATLIVCGPNEEELEQIIKNWSFYSEPSNPLMLDMPALSTLERLTMESRNNAKEIMDFELPRSDLGCDPFESFEQFYRVFPHFSRVEL